LVAEEDIKVYRRGRLVTDHRAFVLTSLYQVPATWQTVDDMFDVAPRLSLPTLFNSSSTVTLTFTAKAVVHGNLYMGFTLVDEYELAGSNVPSDQTPAGPNTTQFIFVHIMPVNSPPTMEIVTPNQTLPSPTSAHPAPVRVRLNHVISHLSTGAVDEDLIQTLSLRLRTVGAGCSKIFDEAVLLLHTHVHARTHARTHAHTHTHTNTHTHTHTNTHQHTHSWRWR
jgi:hypothetical protein